MIKYLVKIHMNTTSFFRKRNVVLFVTSSILIIAVLVSVIGRPTNMTGTTIGNNSNQNYIMMYTYGPNITGSVPVGQTITKSIESQVHISLSNASNIAEKAVGDNAHTAAVRIGVVYGFLVYKALVVDSSNGCRDILVNAGNRKVLATVQRSWF